jgi:hypothetical protein
MGDAGAGDCLCEDSDHKAEHGGTTVEELRTLELLEMNQLLSTVLEPFVIGWSIGHGEGVKGGEGTGRSVGGIGLEDQGCSQPGANKEQGDQG